MSDGRASAPAKSATALRVLGVDTSLRSTGLGVVEAAGNALRVVTYGRIVNPAPMSKSRCLDRVWRGIGDLIAQESPSAMAIEGIFFCKNVKTAVTLGEARGAAIAAAVAAGIPVFEYAPRRVKQAVVGIGAAGKEQVRRMIMALLSLSRAPPEDAADALAIAICHLHSMRHPVLKPEAL